MKSLPDELITEHNTMIPVKGQHNADVEFGIKTHTKLSHVQVGGCSCAKQLLHNIIIVKYINIQVTKTADTFIICTSRHSNKNNEEITLIYYSFIYTT